MIIYISECVLGIFAFDEKKKLIDSVQFPREANEVAERLELIRKGVPTDEHRELIRRLTEKRYERFSFESEGVAKELQKGFKKARFEASTPNEAGKILRSSLPEIAKSVGFDRVDELMRKTNLLLTRGKMREEATERDKLVIHAIDMLDELDKTINTMCGRIREWYSIHFSELDRLVPEHEIYLRLILEVGPRERYTESSLKAIGLPEEREGEILKAAKSSIGGAFDSLDIQALRECTKEVLTMQEVREHLDRYIDELLAQVAPNLRALVGGGIGARLISLAGGIENLARMPASTLQVLGAEKALFRSLHTHRKPPKHGVIYQYPEIRGSPKWQRGKIARALAGKLTIAARVDALSGEFIGDKLGSDLKSRISEIKSKYRESGERGWGP